MEKSGKEAKPSGSIAEPVSFKRILLADDSKTIREVVSEFLELIGYEVTLAINGIDALAVFLENSFDLILTDLEMPAMDGLSLAGHIKEKSPNMPVILLTGSDSETVLKIKRGLFNSVLFKPFPLEDLQSAIQNELRV